MCIVNERCLASDDVLNSVRSDCRRINVIHQSFNLREDRDRFKIVELKKSGIRGRCFAAYHARIIQYRKYFVYK